MIGLRFSFDGEPRRAFAAARARGEDLRPAYRSMAQAGVAQTKKRFITKRAPDGSTWKGTRKIGGTTMIASGLLLRSISATPPTHSGVEWGSRRVYAAQRQFGGTIKARAGGLLRFRASPKGNWFSAKEVTQPARAYLGANDADMGEFAAIGLRHVAGPLGEGSV